MLCNRYCQLYMLYFCLLCEGLSAVLSGHQPPLRVSTGAGASGLFELSKDGSLTFEVKL